MQSEAAHFVTTATVIVTMLSAKIRQVIAKERYLARIKLSVCSVREAQQARTLYGQLWPCDRWTGLSANSQCERSASEGACNRCLR